MTKIQQNKIIIAVKDRPQFGGRDGRNFYLGQDLRGLRGIAGGNPTGKAFPKNEYVFVTQFCCQTGSARCAGSCSTETIENDFPFFLGWKFVLEIWHGDIYRAGNVQSIELDPTEGEDHQGIFFRHQSFDFCGLNFGSIGCFGKLNRYDKSQGKDQGNQPRSSRYSYFSHFEPPLKILTMKLAFSQQEPNQREFWIYHLLKSTVFLGVFGFLINTAGRGAVKGLNNVVFWGHFFEQGGSLEHYFG